MHWGPRNQAFQSRAYIEHGVWKADGDKFAFVGSTSNIRIQRAINQIASSALSNGQ